MCIHYDCWGDGREECVDHIYCPYTKKLVASNFASKYIRVIDHI